MVTPRIASARLQSCGHGGSKIEPSQKAQLRPDDVAIMMALFKIARIAGNAQHEDNYVDLAGYAALAGEISTVE